MFQKHYSINQIVRLSILGLILFGLASSIIQPFTTSAASSLPVKTTNSPRSVALSNPRAASPLSAERLQSLGHLPLRFETNLGQADSRVKFIGRGRGYTVFLTSTEAVLSLRKAAPLKTSRNGAAGQSKTTERDKQTTETTSLRMKLIGARSNASAAGEEESANKSNYFVGKDPAKWRSGIQNFAKVKYGNVYPGVDLIYYGNQGQLEYDFVVAPGANPKRIRLEFNGADKVYLDSSGDLVLNTNAGEIRQSKPMVYQEAGGVRREISGEYVLKGKRRVGFRLGDYDATKPLVIDPVISYSTLLGGSGGGASSFGSSANGIATHTAADGNVYVYLVGTTNETDFPIRNAAQAAFGGTGTLNWYGDVFVAKFNMSASGDASLVYSTYLGGSNNEDGAGIAVDSAGRAYVVGSTLSSDFPILGAAQSSRAGGYRDAFVAALTPDGSSLVYSTYLGGSNYGAAPYVSVSGDDLAQGVAVDSAGNAYVTGSTGSRDFPTTTNAFQSIWNTAPNSWVYYLTGQTYYFYPPKAFLTKIAPPSGSNPASFVYSTYLGGSGAHASGDSGNSIAVDPAGNAFMTGTTESADFPVLSGFKTQRNCRLGNAFMTKLNPSASGAASLLHSTYIGCGTGNAIAVDAAGCAYVTGFSSRNPDIPGSDPDDFPTTPGAFMPNKRSDNAGFVAKLDPAKTGASSFIYSTFLGGTNFNSPEDARSIAVDAEGNAYVTGHTSSFDFPLVNATQSFNNGVLQSINGGGDWKSISNGIATPVIKALAVDTSTSPRTLYAGGRDILNADLSVHVSGGVYKSIDGGLNWSPINSGLTNTDIRGLVISPTNPSRLYAATRAGVFKTDDGGVSWSAFNTGLSTAALTSLTDLAFDSRTSPATLYVAAGDDLYKISDGGSNWSVTGFTTGVRFLTVDASTSPGTLYIEGGDYRAYRSSDQGTSWTDIQTDTGWYDMGGPIGVDPTTTPSTLYRGDPYGENLFKSVNGGESWQLIARISGDPYGKFTVDTTTTPSTLYIDHSLYADFGGGAGLWRSIDGGNTWTRILGRNAGAFALDATTATATTPSTLYFSTGFPAPDAFVAKLNSTGSALLFSTYLGGYGTDYGQGIALDPSGNIYVAGKTQEGPFPTVNAYQATSRASSYPNIDAFVVKLGSAALVSSSTERVTTELGIQTGTLELSFPNITGSTSGTAPTATVNALDSTTTANLTLSNNLGAYEIKTTATYDTLGYATDPTTGIKIAFSVPTVNDVTVFNNLVISHGEDANADSVIQPGEMIPYNGTIDPNKVTHHDFATRTIWVYVPSLSPFVIVKGAGDQLNDLVRLIKSFNLKAGIENSLDAKLQNALKAYQAALAKDRPTACNQMGAFTSEARAQTGKALTQSQANQLIAAANQITVVLGCR